jgi:energy-coupling factor transporter ATP-binding protein EcfA2
MGVENYRILLDLPSKTPALGFNQYAEALKNILEQGEPQFAVGIFGGWGSGKTTLMQAIESRLNKENTISVQFSAWRYEKEKHLIVPLLDTVRESLVQWSGQRRTGWKDAKKTASTIGKVMASLIAGLSLKIGVPGSVELSFDANKALASGRLFGEEERNAKVPRSFYHASFRALNGAFSQLISINPEFRIVVFIDDLDRCLPEGTLEVLESMKLFFDLRGFVFVVGLDRSVVEWCIDNKYGTAGTADDEENRAHYQIRGSDYIKKIFQVPFRLAPVGITQLSEFLDSLYAGNLLPTEQIDEIRTRVEAHLRFLVTNAGINPREIKRYINAYTLLVKVKPHLERDAVLALQTLSFRTDWRSAREALYAYREVFIDALRRQLVEEEENALEDLDPDLETIPQSFLNYLGPDSAGHPLLSARPLDEYIYSGEATLSTQNLALLDLIHDVTNIRRSMRSILENDVFDAKEMTSVLSQAKSLQSMARDILGGHPARSVYNNLRDIMNGIENMQKGQELAEAMNTWNEQVDPLVRQTVTNLLDLYQFPSGTPIAESAMKK